MKYFIMPPLAVLWVFVLYGILGYGAINPHLHAELEMVYLPTIFASFYVIERKKP